MYPPAVAVSAPGKVLFTGGFLVLDRQHRGLVLGLNARIHVHITSWETATTNQKGLFLGRGILVQSPQFKDARWLYEAQKSDGDAAVSVTQVVDLQGYTQTPNKFVETTLRYALTYLSHLSRNIEHSIVITILADDDYYSQQAGATKDYRGSNGDFTNFGVSLSEAHKTGLGSSAALTTSFVAALLSYSTAAAPSDISPLPLKTIHNLAQAAHCAAQGKVGSGFDVAAAVYGSCLYRRFTPTILERIGDSSTAGFGERLHQCVEDLDLEHKWDVEVASQAVQLPKSLLLLMCDVDCGSETPGMVRNVLKWRKENPEDATVLWTAIQQGSDDLCQELRRLAGLEGIGPSDFRDLGNILQAVRSLVREMSQKSEVPIEPPVITELLDHCTAIEGVVGGVAPGAGGYDAVALLVINHDAVVKELQASLRGWKSKGGSGAVIGNVRLLGVKQADEGVRTEEAGRYQGWV
jgi:phosphomevalonate kinase